MDKDCTASATVAAVCAQHEWHCEKCSTRPAQHECKKIDEFDFEYTSVLLAGDAATNLPLLLDWCQDAMVTPIPGQRLRNMACCKPEAVVGQH